MAKRILIGNRTVGGYGLYVSKSGAEVDTCDKSDLLLDSTQRTGGTGQVYAGGFQSALSSSLNFLTTSSKPSLGYIPLVVFSEDMQQNHNWSTGGGYQTREWFASRVDVLQTTTSTITPYKFDSLPVTGRRTTSEEYGLGTSQACTNLSFVVLKIPCAYGYMNSTYFVEG